MTIRLKLSATLVALSLPLALPAWSAGGGGGDGGGGGGGGGGGTPTEQNCPSGQVRDKATKKCVPARQGAVDDDSLFEAGRALAYQGRYGEAIAILGLVADKDDPRVLNMLGFSHRKSGRIEVGLGYYEAALAADPDFTLAREYMGEAFITLGDLASAREQLVEIERRCGKGCAEYSELERQILAAGRS